MGAFTPFKRHATSFKYTPRYYDPTKEAREQRREEMTGHRSDQTTEYRPGDYIRRSSAARAARRGANTNQGGRGRLLVTLGVVVIVALFGSILFSRVIAMFDGSSSSVANTTEEEFNPYTPITIVPNDYVEGAE